MSLIEARKLSKVYNEGTTAEVRALWEVDVTINAGEFISIMGPSGSGKSTLLHMLGFLDRPTRGTYHFDGKSMNDYSSDGLAHVRNKKMGFVFQSFNLLSRTSVLDNVKLPLLYSSIPVSEWDEMAKKAIAMVDLSDREGHEPSELSGGEKQRVAIARALVNNPEVIFADEPTGNLDSVSGGIIMDTLDKLNTEQGKTIIVITHETSTASYAKRIIRLLDGSIDKDEQVTNRTRGQLTK